MISKNCLIFLGILTVVSARSWPTLSVPLRVVNDNFYVADISVGWPQQSFSVGLSTSISNTFIPSISCKTCEGKNLFNEDKSSTYNLVGDDVIMTMTSLQMTISVEGNLSTDSFTVADLLFKNQMFIDVTEETNFQFPVDGMISLAINNDSLITNMYSEGLISSPILGYYISQNSGELSFGAPNPKHYTSLYYFNLTLGPSWSLPLDNMIVSPNIDVLLPNKAYETLFDPFVPNIQSGYNTITIINKALGATLQNGSYIFSNCNNFDDYSKIDLVFGDHRFQLQPEEYIANKDGQCYSKFVINISLDDSVFVMGQPFFKSVYTVFDFGNQQIGLGLPTYV